MANFTRYSIPNHYIGQAADTKPTGVAVGSLAYAYDTATWYITYDGTTWVVYKGEV